eukprot:2836629-Amphidinium_carterae.1
MIEACERFGMKAQREGSARDVNAAFLEYAKVTCSKTLREPQQMMRARLLPFKPNGCPCKKSANKQKNVSLFSIHYLKHSGRDVDYPEHSNPGLPATETYTKCHLCISGPLPLPFWYMHIGADRRESFRNDILNGAETILRNRNEVIVRTELSTVDILQIYPE